MSMLALIAQDAAVQATPRLTAGTLAFMLLAMTAVTSLTVWCFMRIMRGRRHFDPDGTGPAEPPVRGKLEREA